MAKKKSKNDKILIGTIIVILGISIIFLGNMNVSYTAKVIYEEEESYVDYEVETYQEVVEKKDCDYETNCRCIKHGFWSGLIGDYCIRCSCERTRTVPITKYRTVQKEKFEEGECPLFKKLFNLCEGQV